MLNTFVLVGKVAGSVERKDGYSEFQVLCTRPFCEKDGHPSHDLFTVRAWKGISDEIRDLMQDGILVSIKGRMCMEKGCCILIAEHVSIERLA